MRRQILTGSTATLLLLVALCTPGCDGDDDTAPSGQAGAPACMSSGGPVEDGATDLHCTDKAGDPIVQSIGKCVTDTEAGTGGTSGHDDGTAGHDDAGHADGGGAGHDEGGHEEEEHATLTSNHGADDDCKYDVSFTNGCIERNKPVTFKLTLHAREDGHPATGAHPDSPEIYLADDPSHISPSFNIKAPESPPGTYSISPIVFDAPGRWVVRFHFFETCSDLPEDSPHGHIAFYIDVP